MTYDVKRLGCIRLRGQRAWGPQHGAFGMRAFCLGWIAVSW